MDHDAEPGRAVPDPSGSAADRIGVELRSSLEATWLDDGAAWRVSFVTDPVSGCLVVNAPGEAAEREHLVIAAPDEGGVQALCEGVRRLDVSRDPLCDRWRAFHRDDRHASFVACEVVSAKSDDGVVSGADLCLASPVARDEAGLCRAWNAERSRLGVFLSASEGELPLVVGVDGVGVWLRLRFGVRFVAFARPARTGDEARVLFEQAMDSRR